MIVSYPSSLDFSPVRYDFKFSLDKNALITKNYFRQNIRINLNKNFEVN